MELMILNTAYLKPTLFYTVFFKKIRFLFVEDMIILGSSALSNRLPVTTKKGWIFKRPIPAPCSRVLDNIIGPALLKKFPLFSGIRFFYRIYNSPPPFVSWSRSIQSMPPDPTSWGYIWIFSYHPWLSIPIGLFPAGFLLTPRTHLSSHTNSQIPSPFQCSWFDHRNNIRLRVQIIMLLTLQHSPFPYCFVRLRPRYIYKRPFLKNTQPTFLPQCKRPHFPLISNNQQNYRSVCFHVCILDSKVKHNGFCTQW